MNTVTPIAVESTLLSGNGRRLFGSAYLKRGLIALIVVVTLALVYKIAADRLVEPADLSRGLLLNVEDHQMFIQCTGEGSPTVILEAGSGHFSASWAWVQRTLAATTRVCAYDRAGYGQSQPGPEPRDAYQITGELHRLLKAAEIEPPYVLVGHSAGGLYTRVYNAQYPGEVVGMVLVDATHPDNWVHLDESVRAIRAMAAVSSTFARAGLLTMLINNQDLGLPAAQNAVVNGILATSQYWETRRADTEAILSTHEQARSTGDLGDMPLAVLAALTDPQNQDDTERALQLELVALSTNSTYQEVAGAGHITLVTSEPYAQFVNNTILQVIDAVRSGDKLKS